MSTWLERQLGVYFGHAAVRAKHARHMQGQFRRIEAGLTSYIGLPIDYPKHEKPLEEFLGFDENSWPQPDQIRAKIERFLPSFSGPEACISFSRLKDVEKLSEKMSDASRGNPDTFGIQLWINNPSLFREIEKLDSPQSAFRKRWERHDVGFKLHSHFAEPKLHGYRAIHLDFTGKASKGWSENMEMQILPIQMMVAYLHTRMPYRILREIISDVRKRHGKNENNWPKEDLIVINPLRDYIRANFEAVCHELGLMDMLNFGYERGSSNNKEALEQMEHLEAIIEAYVSLYSAGYSGEPRLFLEHAGPIITNGS